MAKRCKNPSCKFGKNDKQRLFETTFSSLQVCCCIACAIEWGKTKESKIHQEKIQKKIWRNEKAAFKKKNDKLSVFIKKAQTEFNKFIRLRDAHKPCVTCGTFNPSIHDRFGGVWDAGHYKTVGGHPELRFIEINCHKQCKGCNNPGPKKADWVREQYDIGILDRINQDQLDWINGHHKVLKLNREDLIEKAKHYRAKWKELAERAA